MADEEPPKKVVRRVPSVTQQRALINASRVLEFAEAETNLQLGQHLVAVADSWIAIASLLGEK